jgi:hypothetical protein
MTTVAHALAALKRAVAAQGKPRTKKKTLRKPSAKKKPVRRVSKVVPVRAKNPAPRKHHKYHIALMPAFDSLASAEEYARKFAAHHRVQLQIVSG